MGERKARRYTVVGYYDDNLQVWVRWVRATSGDEAMKVAVRELHNQTEAIPVEAFLGHIRGQGTHDFLTKHQEG